MKIIVLDGNENQAVACVRSLARAGHQVVVGAPTSWSKAGWSRYCKETFVYSAPDVSAFVERVVQEVRREPGAEESRAVNSARTQMARRRDGRIPARARRWHGLHAGQRPVLEFAAAGGIRGRRFPIDAGGDGGIGSMEWGQEITLH